MPTTLKDKVALVTGGSGGIGSAICDRLSAEGAAVVVHSQRLTSITGLCERAIASPI